MRTILAVWILSLLWLQGSLFAQVNVSVSPSGGRTAQPAEFRDWRNTDGRTIRAQLRTYDGVTAQLLMNGRVYPVGKDKLSPADQAYLAAWLSRQSGTFVPPKPITLSADTLATAPELDFRVVEKMVHAVVNRERLKRDLGELAWSDQVAAIARAHSEDMAKRNFFSHLNPEGEDPSARAARQGWTKSKRISGDEAVFGLGENIGLVGRYHSLRRELRDGKVLGFKVRWQTAEQMADQIVNGWLKSPQHRKNLLDPDRELEGIGLGVRREHVYATQNLF